MPLLDEAEVERVVFGPRSRVIDVGERARFFTGATRRAVEVRDRRCTWPGCDTPAEQCEIDHVDTHATGGPTTQDNGEARCGYHHRHRYRGHLPPDPDPDVELARRHIGRRLDELRALAPARFAT